MLRIRLIGPQADVPGALPGPVHALVLTAGPAAAGLCARAGVAVLERHPLTTEAGESFARDYADFLGALNTANASLEWWASTLAGKNPVSSPLPRRCHDWQTVLEAAERLREGTLAIVLDDPVLAAAIKDWAKGRGMSVEGGAGGLTAKQALNRMIPSGPLWGFLRALWRLGRSRAVCRFQPEHGARYAVVATLLNHQSFLPDGRYRDTYFGELSGYLAERGLKPLVFGSITHDFERTLARSSAVSEGAPIIPMELFLGLEGLLTCLGQALRRRLFGCPLKGSLVFRGRDVSALVRAELAENDRASRLFSDLWYHACAAALARRVDIEAFYYPFENRAWERMLVMALRQKSPLIPLIGYQHAAMTPNHLNYMLGRAEESSLPLPDRIVTLGEVTRRLLIGRGRFPRDMVVGGCALRQRPARAQRSGPARTSRLLVTLATSVAEYAAVLRLLDATFAESGPEILIRPHPEFPLEDGLALSGPVRAAYRESKDMTLEESLDWADAVLYASSTLGLEAVRQGLPAVYLRLSGFLDTDPLAGFDALKWSASEPEGLRRSLAEIAALSPEDLGARRAAAAAYAAGCFNAVTAENLAPFVPPRGNTPASIGANP